MCPTTILAHLEATDRIQCETGRSQSRPQGYPVLRLGEVTLFPTGVDQLRQVRDVITAWLDTEAARIDPRIDA